MMNQSNKSLQPASRSKPSSQENTPKHSKIISIITPGSEATQTSCTVMIVDR